MGTMATMPACDLCHTRKVKCDRQDPCMNCVDAQVDCLRTREARVHRPRVSRLDALSERLAKLEKSKSDASIFSPSTTNESHTGPSSPQAHLSLNCDQLDVFKSSSKRKYQSGFAAHDISPTARSDSKRRISQSFGSNMHPQHHSPSSDQHATEAREYIEHELQCNPALSKDRRTTLEMAEKFVSQLSNPGIHRYENGAVDQLEIEDIAPPIFTAELLYMMLPGTDKETSSQGTIVWPDHISDKTLERMGLAILERSESEPVLKLYRVVVWIKAIAAISKLSPLISSQPLKLHFRTLKKQYETAAIEELYSIPLIAPPSLTLLQALLSGKRLMQYLGNMPRCWMFTAFASKVIVALNYHNITSAIPQNEKEEEIHACVYTCYYFDSTLSLLLLRPPSLPKLKIEPAQLIHLDPDMPTTPMIVGIVELSHIKSALLQILLDTKGMEDMEKATFLSDLVVKAQKIYANLQIHRSRQEHEFPASSNLLRRRLLDREWLSVDFNYYSALTTLIRTHSSVLKSRVVCKDCVYAARKALASLISLMESFADDDASIDSYPYFLTWTMLLFPLSPFFVLFCNVVATSDSRDFDMIKKITGDLRQFAKANASIGKLYGLFSKFLDLCAPLIKKNPWLSDAPTPGFQGDFKMPAQLSGSYAEIFGQGTTPLSSAGTVPGVPQSVPSVEGWDDSLMWELFDNQPSLGWAESELWDAMAQHAV